MRGGGVALTPLEAIGPFPPLLFKAFRCREHAEDLVRRGRLRLSEVKYFARIEDPARVDRTEGRSQMQIEGDVTKVAFDLTGNPLRTWQEPGSFNFTGEFINPVYIACFCYPPDGDQSRVPSKFGRYLVRIANPRRFAQEITDWLTQEGALRDTPVVECLKVLYNKGDRSKDVKDGYQRTQLSYSQKPSKFADEFEYRFTVVAPLVLDPKHSPGEHYFVDLGRPLDYVELLQTRPSNAGAV
jgi:hypothetical protein